MYVRTGYGSLGCSVKEINGLSAATKEELVNILGGGATICVTSGHQQVAENALKGAGYVLLAEYKNFAAGHGGNKCKLWAGFKPQNKAALVPDEITALRKQRIDAVKKKFEEAAAKKIAAAEKKLQRQEKKLETAEKKITKLKEKVATQKVAKVKPKKETSGKRTVKKKT